MSQSGLHWLPIRIAVPPAGDPGGRSIVLLSVVWASIARRIPSQTIASRAQPNVGHESECQHHGGYLLQYMPEPSPVPKGVG